MSVLFTSFHKHAMFAFGVMLIHIMLKEVQDHPSHVMVWLALFAHYLIGPYFFYVSVNWHSYLLYICWKVALYLNLNGVE